MEFGNVKFNIVCSFSEEWMSCWEGKGQGKNRRHKMEEKVYGNASRSHCISRLAGLKNIGYERTTDLGKLVKRALDALGNVVLQ